VDPAALASSALTPLSAVARGHELEPRRAPLEFEGSSWKDAVSEESALRDTSDLPSVL